MVDSNGTVIKGIVYKENKTAKTIILIACAALVCALLYSIYAFRYLERYFSLGFGYGGVWYYFIGYDNDFLSYFFGEFFSFRLMYGYVMIASIIALIVGIFLKNITEGCELSVTTTCLLGKDGRGKNIELPLNQITAIHTCSFNGISVSAIARSSKFYLFQNQEEIIKVLSSILTTPNHSYSNSKIGSNAERLEQLKYLLDSNVITQAEFDAKKKELLDI